MWDSVISDCNECLDLSPNNLKAHYYRSQAHLALHDYNDALQHAKYAHDLCVKSGETNSLAATTAQVLHCKKDRWEHMERRRVREGTELESEVLAMMERERDMVLGEPNGEVYRKEIEQEWEQRITQMRRVFERSRTAEEKKRKVPDWAIDEISFGIMVDPVVVGSPSPTEAHAKLLLTSTRRPRLASRMSVRPSWNTLSGIQPTR
jgi:STIP1 family protein 1